MKKKAFSYVRMSTEIQLKGDSRRRQLERSKTFADKKGYEFIESLEDIGISAFKGKNQRGGELGKFRELLISGEINASNTVLLVESLDRLSRENVLDAFEDLNSFLKTGLTVVTISDEQEYTRESLGSNVGMLYMAFGVMIRANEESQTKSDRLKEAWKVKRKKISEKKITSIIPAWITLNKGTNEFEGLDAKPVEIVRKIFDLCIDGGMGAMSIAQYLNDHLAEYPKFTKPRKKNRVIGGHDKTGWYASYIKKILKNPAVYGSFQLHEMSEGKRVPVGEPIDSYFPEVISKDRYLLAQAKISERRVAGAGRRGRTFSNLFTNILKCGSCGGSIIYRDKGKPPKGGLYLRCHNSELHANCSSASWQYEKFEASFFEFITEVTLQAVFNLDEEQSQIKKLHDKKLVIDQELTVKQKKYKTLRQRVADETIQEDVLVDLFSDLSISKTKVDEIRGESEQLRSQLAELESRNPLKTHDEIIRLFKKLNKSENLTDDEKKELRQRVHAQIRSVVKVIKLNNDYRPPHPLDYEDELSDSFLALLVEKKVFKWPPKVIFETVKEEETYVGQCWLKIENFMKTDYGIRLYAESERNFTVYFKSGISKVVTPFLGISRMLVSDKMAKFHSNK